MKPALKDATEGLTAYLSQLLERQILDVSDLTRFISSLERGEIWNPIPEERAWVSIDARYHRDEIQEYINKTQLNLERLMEWAVQNIQEQERVQIKRDETRDETRDIHQKIEFHAVRPGSFLMGSGRAPKRTVILANPFEVMSKPVTQAQWVEIMGANPSHFADGEHSIVLSINGRPVKMQPDNPVENVSWYSVLVFANKLSEKHGLNPAYDFGSIQWKHGTSAEAGTLDSSEGQVKINAPSGDYYQADGYRLPTEVEQEYMLRAAGTANGKYHFGDNDAELKDHAWYSENSGERTQPVGQLKPLILDGKAFYDLHGNVREWGWDSTGMKIFFAPSSASPTKSKGIYRVIRGGSWFSQSPSLHSGAVGDEAPGSYSPEFGLRLVRTLE